MSRVKLITCLTVITLVGILLFLAAKSDAREETGIPEEESRQESAAELPEVTRFLFLGCDRAASLADSILLVSVSTPACDVRILQIPRDTYAAYTDRDYRKLNGAPGVLGIGETRDWLAAALGVRIDYVAALDLDCVSRLVDAVGGVDVEIPQAMHYSDPAQGLEIDLPEGRNHLDGAEAEQFVRFRAGYADADLGRLDAQKRFLQALYGKCRSLPAPQLLGAVLAVLPDLQTDLPIDEAVKLAMCISRAQGGSVTAETAPGEAVQGVSGAWYYVLNREKMTGALERWGAPEAASGFDPERLFDRPENPDFHRIYTASEGEP